MQSAFQHCAALVREADRDRYLATLFAPGEHRDALFALYAFNVEITRVRDLAREPMPGEIRLQWWREVLCGERQDEARAHPVAAALREILMRYRLSAMPLIGLVDARTFDLYDEPMASLADLQRYGEQTESAVFAMAAAMLGAGDAATQAATRHAGIAYGIAWTLAGLAKHASRRQFYLPADLLARHGVERERIFAGEFGEPLRVALADMRDAVRHHLTAAGERRAAVPKAVLPALLPLALVGPSLRRMEENDYDPFRPQPVPTWRRQWLLWRAARDPRRIFSA